MNKLSIFSLIFFLFSFTLIFADYRITRGPEVGEIYFIGPTVTQPSAIYHSTDFGQTATCMDSISEVISICADLTPGSIYRIRMPNVLYYSSNFGHYTSWIFRSNDIYEAYSGRNEGFVYNRIGEHSEDYGTNFTQHSCNGFFGTHKASELDNQDSVGYALTSQYSVYDSLWLLVSFDNFENFDNQYVFNWNQTNNVYLTRGYVQGKLYALRSEYTADGSRISELWYSSDFGENWVFKNHLLSNCIVGGRQSGEVYVLANYTQLMGEIKHTYIYHSLDYGETFTVYHPFSYGPDPYFANLEAEPTTGDAPLNVQFTDLSSGEDIQTWEWDFDNDGTIDSFEQNPEYTYQDTGSYSVKLKIYYGPLEDGFIKTNYIHVTDGSGVDSYELEITNYELNNYPNPFNPETTIKFDLTTESTDNTEIIIYNVKGQKIDEIEISNQQTSVNWDAEKFASGIYIYKLNSVNSPVKKMILIK